MSHLSRDECLLALDDALDPPRRAHLASCPVCLAEVDSLASVVARVKAVTVPEPSPLFWDHLAARVGDAIAREPAPAPARWSVPRPRWRVVVPALLFVAVAGSLRVRPPAATHAAAAPNVLATAPASSSAAAPARASAACVADVSLPEGQGGTGRNRATLDQEPGACQRAGWGTSMRWFSTNSGGRAAVATAVAILAVAHVPGADVYTRADSTSMKQKIDAIVQAERAVQQARALSRTPAPVRTTPLTQREVNSYLRYDLAAQVPTGITEPVITIVGQGRLTGEAIVDLDAVSRANPPKGFFDPMRLLTGRLPVRVEGVLTTSQGTGRFSLELATIAGLPVPKSVLQSLVSYYSRSDTHPNGVGIDDPFALPAAIREIRVEPGRAIVVQ